jgi:hypothetical protein
MSQPNRDSVLRFERSPALAPSGFVPEFGARGSEAEHGTLVLMRFLATVCAVFCFCGFALAQRRPDVQVVEAKARRVEEGRIAVDGRVKVTGEKPVKGLVIVFDFLSTEGETLTSQKVQVEDGVVDRGEESTFHAATLNPPGAVRFRLRAFDAADRELRLGNNGPFTIE